VMLAALQISSVDGTPLARISGEVDASNARQFTSQLTDSVPNTAMGLVIDLTETEYLDSSGVKMLFAVADALNRRQQQLRLVAAPESFIADVLAAVNLGDWAESHASVSEAMAALEAK
jgi:anti-anti-sigma factor